MFTVVLELNDPLPVPSTTNAPQSAVPVHLEVVGDFAGLPGHDGARVELWTWKSSYKGGGFRRRSWGG